MSSESTNGKNTQTTTQESKEQTEKEQKPVVSGKQIGIRLLYTILFLVILGIVMVIVKVTVVFQFIYFFSTRKPNESVRQFSNKISTYGYRIFRYITLNESQRPFPFTDLPPELEPSEEQIIFD
jgi:flagellar basal body-associated protein FliL